MPVLNSSTIDFDYRLQPTYYIGCCRDLLQSVAAGSETLLTSATVSPIPSENEASRDVRYVTKFVQAWSVWTCLE